MSDDTKPVYRDNAVKKLEPEPPVEFSGVKTFLRDLIAAEDNLTKLREILSMVLGLGGDSIEKQQLDLLQLEWGKRHGELLKEVSKIKKVTTGMAIGLILLSGYIGLDVSGVLKLFGLG